VLRLKTSGGGGEYGEGIDVDMGGADITPIGLYSTKRAAMAAMRAALQAFKTSMTDCGNAFTHFTYSKRAEDPWAALGTRACGETNESPVRSIRMGRGYDDGYEGTFDDLFATFAVNRVRLNRTVDEPSQVEDLVELEDELGEGYEYELGEGYY